MSIKIKVNNVISSVFLKKSLIGWDFYKIMAPELQIVNKTPPTSSNWTLKGLYKYWILWKNVIQTHSCLYSVLSMFSTVVGTEIKPEVRSSITLLQPNSELAQVWEVLVPPDELAAWTDQKNLPEYNGWFTYCDQCCWTQVQLLQWSCGTRLCVCGSSSFLYSPKWSHLCSSLRPGLTFRKKWAFVYRSII